MAYRFLVLLLVLLLPTSLVYGQEITITTTSDAAREAFEEGREHAANVHQEKAIDRFKVALEEDADFALAHLYLASLLDGEKRKKHFEQAEQRLDAVTEGEQLIIQSYGAHLDGNHEKEYELAKKAAETYPDDVYASLHVGWQEYRRKEYEAARATTQHILEMKPEFAPAYNMLGYIELEAGNYDAAEQALKSYVEAAPDEPNPYDSLGELYLTTDRYDEAIQQFKMALERDADFEISKTNIVKAEIQKVNRQFEDAMAAKNVDQLSEMYTENAVVAPPNRPLVRGRDGVREMYAAGLTGMDRIELETAEIRAFGDQAVEMGESKVYAGEEVVEEGRYMAVWRNVNGQWQIDREVWNSGLEASKPTATVSDEK